jgi:hypothetical protein
MAFTGIFSGLDPAELLIGAPTSDLYRYEQRAWGFQQLDLSFYGRDGYRVYGRLTLALSLRYDNFLGWPWTEVANRQSQPSPTLSTTAAFQVSTFSRRRTKRSSCVDAGGPIPGAEC